MLKKYLHEYDFLTTEVKILRIDFRINFGLSQRLHVH